MQMGFCIFNSVAVAAAIAKRKYAKKRVLILDWVSVYGYVCVYGYVFCVGVCMSVCFVGLCMCNNVCSFLIG